MIPNILTTVRLALVPIFAYFMLVDENLKLAAAIFVLSGVTDVVDGYIARKYNMVSNFGMVYDPFVDKLMQMTAVVCMTVAGIIPGWLLALVIIKEVSMIAVGGVLYLKKIVVHSNWYGKLSTVIFYAAVLVMIMWRNIPPETEILIFVIMIAAMLFAATAYVFDTIKNIRKS